MKEGQYQEEFNVLLIMVQFNNTHQLDTLHIRFHLIKTQSLDMFRASLAHPQEALHDHFWWV
jgi:hypothetical protein